MLVPVGIVVALDDSPLSWSIRSTGEECAVGSGEQGIRPAVAVHVDHDVAGRLEEAIDRAGPLTAGGGNELDTLN